MYKALNYVIRHYEELTAYLDIPEMPLDKWPEREIRAMVMGKKAYLFCQTDDACERAAMMYSFFGACKVNRTGGRVPVSRIIGVSNNQ